MSIRIMHVVDTWAVGGLQNGVANLIDRMDRAHFEHVICAMRRVDGDKAKPAPAGSSVVCLSTAESSSRLQVPALARRIREVQPHIVHTRNWGTFEAQLAARQVGGCARVHSEHGIDWDVTEREPYRRIFCRRLAFQLADRVLTVSRWLRDLHAKRTRFPAHKIEVIHNGVDSGRYGPDTAVRARIRRELGISDEDFCIGAVGNLIPVKDQITLLRAVAAFDQTGRPWRLVVVGSGPELPRLSAFIDNYPAWKHRVLFLGRSNSVRELLNAMDVYVLSSLTEGISNSLLEAMATGLPVLATDTGGNPEVIGEDAGILFRVGDSEQLMQQLVRLETQPSSRHDLGQRALRRVRDKFSMNSMVEKYTQVYGALGSAASRRVCAVAEA